MISQKAKYALRALAALARAADRTPMLIAEIAEQQKIPKKFLEQILLDLKHRGLVMSRRGKDGGYWLARRPSEISYGDIIRLTRGSLALVPCASRLAYEPCKNCVTQEDCRIRFVMLQVRDEMARILDTMRLSDPLPVPLEDVAAE